MDCSWATTARNSLSHRHGNSLRNWARSSLGSLGGIANHVAEHLQIENRLAALGEIRDKEPANRDRHRCRGVDERVSVFAAGR